MSTHTNLTKHAETLCEVVEYFIKQVKLESKTHIEICQLIAVYAAGYGTTSKKKIR